MILTNLDNYAIHDMNKKFKEMNTKKAKDIVEIYNELRLCEMQFREISNMDYLEIIFKSVSGAISIRGGSDSGRRIGNSTLTMLVNKISKLEDKLESFKIEGDE